MHGLDEQAGATIQSAMSEDAGLGSEAQIEVTNAFVDDGLWHALNIRACDLGVRLVRMLRAVPANNGCCGQLRAAAEPPVYVRCGMFLRRPACRPREQRFCFT